MTLQDRTSLDTAIERIRFALERGAVEEAVRLFLELHPADRAEAFEDLHDEEQRLILANLDIASTADLFDQMDEEDVLDFTASMSTEKLADVLDEMEPDEAADLLGDLPPDQASEALAHMEDADEVIPLLGYPDETAGGLMTTSFIALRRLTPVSQAIEFLREVSPETSVPYYLYVVDRERRLIGVVGLRDLVISPPDTPMEAIMDPEVIYVTAGTDQEEVAQVMARYDLSAVPVVDRHQRLIGVITHDDLVDVLEQEATEDIYALANVSDSDLEPESPILEQLRGRLPWLYLNTLTALFASWVISRFEHIIAQVAVLAVFQSVVAGQGGNAASQNVAMIVRSLALGKVEPKALGRVLLRQVVIGATIGLAVGTVVGVGVTFWRGNPYLGLVLGLALLGNMIVASIIGVLVPLGLKSLGMDPALASSVLVTAATDSAGFFIFLSLAKSFLEKLM